jgi:hypothetical protein
VSRGVVGGLGSIADMELSASVSGTTAADDSRGASSSHVSTAFRAFIASCDEEKGSQGPDSGSYGGNLKVSIAEHNNEYII